MGYHSWSEKTVIGSLIIILCLAGLMLPASAIILTPGASPSSASTISKGDPVTITGVATGHPREGLQIWLIGYNKVEVNTVSVNDDNTYTYEIKSADTQDLASGQYLIIVQHPMMNGQFDITYSAATGQVINQQLGGGTAIFQLTNAGSLQSPDGASALMRAINSQNVDDTFATASFSTNPPEAFISPIGDHQVGDRFTISGYTNLAAGDKLMVDVYSSSFIPTMKSQTGEYSGASGLVTVTTGSNGRNKWSFDVDASAFKPDEYIVKVSGIEQDVSGSTTFNIVQSLEPVVLATTTVVTPESAIRIPSAAATQITPVTPVTTQRSTIPLGLSAGAVIATIAVFFPKK